MTPGCSASSREATAGCSARTRCSADARSSPSSTGDVGIFHETYVVPADRVESVYGNMTEFGLAAAFGSVERGRGKGRTTAHERLESTEPDYVDAST